MSRTKPFVAHPDTSSSTAGTRAPIFSSCDINRPPFVGVDQPINECERVRRSNNHASSGRSGARSEPRAFRETSSLLGPHGRGASLGLWEDGLSPFAHQLYTHNVNVTGLRQAPPRR